MPITHRTRRAIAGAVVATLAAVGLALVPSAAAVADIETVELGFTPWDVAITPDGTQAYVSDRTGWKVARVDLATHTVIDEIAVTAPGAIAFSPDGARAYVSQQTVPAQINIIDTVTGTLIPWAASTGGNGFSRMAVSPNGNLLVATYPNNELRVFNTTTLTLVVTLPTGDNPAGVAITSNNNTAYVINNIGATFQTLDLAAAPPTISVPYAATTASQLAIAPDDSALYTNTYQAASRINPGSPPTFTESALPLQAGSGTRDLVFDPVGSGDVLYVVDNNNDEVVAIDVASTDIVATFPVGDGPYMIDHSRTSQLLVVANFAATSISIIELAVPALAGDSPAAYVGAPFSFTPTSSGYPAPTFSISAGALPPGLTLDPATGAITGTPTAEGSFEFTILAQNYLGSASIDRTILVQSAAAAPADDEEGLPATGSDSAPVLAAAGLMLLAMGAGVLITRRRIRA